MGELKGLKFDLSKLKEGEPSTWNLGGTIELNPLELKEWMPPSDWLKIAAMWQLGKGCSLRGEWQLSKEMTPKVKFLGKIEGSKIELGGSLFDELSGLITISPNKVEMEDLRLLSQEGSLTLSNIQCFKEEDLWHFNFKDFLVENSEFLKIIIEERFQDAPLPKTEVRELKIDNLSGIFFDCESLLGTGGVQFINISPSFSTRSADEVFFPHMGSFKFIIKESKIFLTHLKDVYSEGRLVKFQLSKTFPSFIDFQGNLDLYLIIKPYQALLKEMRVIQMIIQGSLFQPNYSFNGQTPLHGLHPD